MKKLVLRIDQSKSQLVWDGVFGGGLFGYGLVEFPIGHPEQKRYFSVRGTNAPAKPGYQYGGMPKRLPGYTWADEVKWPKPVVVAPTPPAATRIYGVVVGSAAEWDLPLAKATGADHARMEFDISTPLTTIVPIVKDYIANGITPLILASFNGRLPTTTEARSLGVWASTLGPLGVKHIEFGNETNNPWQAGYPAPPDDGTWWEWPPFIARAKAYGIQALVAAQAVVAAGAGVGLLVCGDQYAGYTTWVTSILAVAPTLETYIAGWVSHPYGTGWKQNLDTLMGLTKRPVFITEIGFATDDGRTLDDNFNWPVDLTYDQAGALLTDVHDQMVAIYGVRLAAFYIYATRDQAAHGATTDREHYFGLMTYAGEPKGGYAAAAKLLLAGH